MPAYYNFSLKLADGATWQQGFRPTRIKVTFTSDYGKMYKLGVGTLADGFAYWGTVNYYSELSKVISCSGDIGRINLWTYEGDLHVTKIELYG